MHIPTHDYIKQKTKEWIMLFYWRWLEWKFRATCVKCSSYITLCFKPEPQHVCRLLDVPLRPWLPFKIWLNLSDGSDSCCWIIKWSKTNSLSRMVYRWQSVRRICTYVLHRGENATAVISVLLWKYVMPLPNFSAYHFVNHSKRPWCILKIISNN